MLSTTIFWPLGVSALKMLQGKTPIDTLRGKNHRLKYIVYKENRIYIRGDFTRKKCKTAILLYCFHTADVLHIFMLYNLSFWALEYHFIENLKLILKETQIMK